MLSHTLYSCVRFASSNRTACERLKPKSTIYCAIKYSKLRWRWCNDCFDSWSGRKKLEKNKNNLHERTLIQEKVLFFRTENEIKKNYFERHVVKCTWMEIYLNQICICFYLFMRMQRIVDWLPTIRLVRIQSLKDTNNGQVMKCSNRLSNHNLHVAVRLREGKCVSKGNHWVVEQLGIHTRSWTNNSQIKH